MQIPPGCRATAIGLAAGLFLTGSNLAAKEKEPAAAISTTDNEAPRLLLANVWNPSIDPTGWWVSEKYDGLRAYWDGQKLWTRKGNLIHAPDYFLAELPRDTVLDGELWIGHGKFEETISIVRSEAPDDRWKQIRYMVFDAPQIKGLFEQRMEFLHATLSKGNASEPVRHWIRHMLFARRSAEIGARCSGQQTGRVCEHFGQRGVSLLVAGET